MKLIQKIKCKFLKKHGGYEALADGSKTWCGYCGEQVR